jgi:NAD(P)-dependent dehydrogenase (short-subunit alcohol dehydrogenase family)
MPHSQRFQGKACLVTASTSGIGKAIAERLASEGGNVFICSRKARAVQETVEELRAKQLSVQGCT